MVFLCRFTYTRHEHWQAGTGRFLLHSRLHRHNLLEKQQTSVRDCFMVGEGERGGGALKYFPNWISQWVHNFIVIEFLTEYNLPRLVHIEYAGSFHCVQKSRGKFYFKFCWHVFTCIKLGDILNDQYAFRHNSSALPARVQNFALKTETFSSFRVLKLCRWDVHTNCTIIVLYCTSGLLPRLNQNKSILMLLLLYYYYFFCFLSES